MEPLQATDTNPPRLTQTTIPKTSLEPKKKKLEMKKCQSNFKKLLEHMDYHFSLLLKENIDLKNENDMLRAKLNSVNLGDRNQEEAHPSFSKKVGAFIDEASSKFKISRQKSSKISSLLRFENTLIGHSDSVVDIICSDSILLSSSLDGSCKIWSIESSQCLATYTGHKGAANAARFSPLESSLICSASGDASLHLWSCNRIIENINLQTPQNKKTIASEDSNKVNTEPHEKSDAFELINLKAPLCELKAHEGPVSCCDWIYDGKSIVSSSWDRTLIIWDVEKFRPISTLTGHEEEVLYLSCHPSQKIFISTSVDSTFRVWDMKDMNKPSITVCNGHTSDVTSAIFFGNSILSGSLDKCAKLWDIKNMREPLASFKASAGINRLSSVHDAFICLPLTNGHIKIYNAQLKSSITCFTQREGHLKSVECCCWHENKNQGTELSLYSSGIDSTIIKWSADISNSDVKK